MSQPLSQTSLRIRAVLSSIRRRTAARWWYKVGLTALSICLIGAAKFDSLSEARAAIRHYATRARSSALTMASDTVFVFGPKQYLTVTNNTQVNYAESFSGLPIGGAMPGISTNGNLPPTQQAFYTMRIRHVGGTLTTATVTLNGTQIATAADFTTPTSIERTVLVNLNGNTLGVTLKGAAAAGLVVTIFSGPTSVFDVFGPKVYQKTATTPTHFVESFVLPAESAVPYTISATANANSAKATITLNGVQVIKDTDFAGATVSRAANLVSGTNSMIVDTRGTTGTTVTVEITANDNTPPVLTITSPTPNLVTNTSSLSVTGTSQDRSPTTVKVNGVVATMSGTGNTQFSATIPLVDGANSIAIQAIDQSGNHTDSARTVTRDTQAPTLTVTSPADNSYTNQDAVTVAGTATDASIVTVKVNGVTLIVGQGGAFSGSYTLAAGANFLTVTATDAGGNVTSQVRKVTQAKQPPVLTVTTPSDGFAKNATPLTVSGTVTGTTPITVSANGVALTVTGSSFSGSVPLVQGANDIAVTATDPASNTTVVHRIGKLDTHPPVLTLTAPTDASYSNATSTTVSGTATDESWFTVSVNGTAVTVAPNGSFTQTVTLAAGANPITVTATDAATNATTLQRTVTQDRTPPALTVTTPADGSYSNATAINVSGTASDASPLTVKVNGSPATVNPDGSFTFSAPLTSGTNTISVIATDAATNATTASRTIIQDRDPPILSVDIPVLDSSGSEVTNAQNAVVIVTATDASPVTVTLNGIPLTVDGNGKYIGSIPLSEGFNPVAVNVTDAAGNNASSEIISIYRDTQPPVVDVASPAEGAHFDTEPVVVNGTITDANTDKNSFSVSVNGVSVTPVFGTPWTFSTPVHLATGSNAISIVVREQAGNTTTLTRTVTFGGVVEGVPPDPATVAPKLDPTVATTTFASTSFLYTGPNPIQTGVAPGTIERIKSSELRGFVQARTGAALPGVKITVLGHPEFGQTLSRADGAFDLVVNGGGLVTLSYEKDGYLPAQRQATVKWQEYARVDSVTLVNLDAASTFVDFSQPAQAAQASLVTDERGTRRTTMIFKGGTHASLIMPDGSAQSVPSLTVRATEYTVGPGGPSAMPGALPAASAYTYAMELSADEVITAGATGVTFDRPVPVYVDNFLNFPTGIAVPLGYYDRAKASWIPLPNGRIVKILGVLNGQVSLDVDGSGSVAPPSVLTAMGFDDPELAKLADLYQPGKTLWRVQVSHFTPHDPNWPHFLPPDASAPNADDPEKQNAPNKDKCADGSIIGCERQTLGESIPVAGTSLSLNYKSDGTAGYRQAYTVSIPLGSGSSLASALRIELQVTIAGQVVNDTFPALPNQVARFVWNGKDVFGRTVQGVQQAHIRIGYRYRSVYADLAAIKGFGDFPNLQITGERGPDETLWQDRYVTLGSRGSTGGTLGGWTLDVHHSFDPEARVLYLGNGTKRSGGDIASAATTVAGADCQQFADSGHCAFPARPGDPALTAYLDAQGMGIASDGTMYFADVDSFHIWRVNSAGTLELVAGNGTFEFNGDGIPATSAGILPAGQLRVGPDNSVYFIDYTGQFGNGRIRRVDKNGIISTVAGSGICGDSVRTGIPATEADLCAYDFTLAKDGTLYVLDGTEVYRVGADGIIRRIVGDGTYARCRPTVPSYVCAEGQPANAHAVFNSLNGIAVGADGSIYLANGEDRVSSSTIIYRIGADGVIRRIAGNGNHSTTFAALGNGKLATDAVINSYSVQPAVAPDGTLYFLGVYLGRVEQSGVLRILAGCVPLPAPVSCVNQGGQRATLTQLFGGRALDFGPDGRIYILDNFARRIDQPVPALGTTDILIASENGSELYVFNADGRHLRTVDALLGQTVSEFGYDSAGLLTSITDADGNVVRLERDVAGSPTTLVAPFGQRTELTLDSGGKLATVRGPGERATVLSYSADGLLTTLNDANGNLHRFAYDDNGLLLRDDDPAGGFKSLLRAVTDSSSAVTVTTAIGTAITHSTTTFSTGATQRKTIDGAGLVSTVVNEVNGAVSLADPDGTITTVTTAGDARLGMQAPQVSLRTTRTPGGMVSTVSGGRRTVLSDAINPFSLVSQLDSIAVNGRMFRSTYVAATRTSTAKTPMGRTSSKRFDNLGRIIEMATPDIAPIHYQYDARGRLALTTQGSRQMSYTYDAGGRLGSTSDPLMRNSLYFYDSVGRLTRRVLTDGREVLYSYDATGNLQSVTPPGRPAHQLEHNAVNLVTAYDPPSVGVGTWSTTYQYDLDHRLAQITTPDGQTVGFGYDVAGRRSSITVPGGAVLYNYDPVTGNATSITGPYGVSLSFSYDGPLVTRAAWAGELTGTLDATYNSDYQVTGLSLNGGPAVGYAYDGDGLLSQAGALTVSRSDSSGLVIGSALGPVSTAQSYTAMGELSGQTASVNGSALFGLTYGRDAIGRIGTSTETVGSTTTTKEYTYDVAGRLTEVRVNGALSTVYEYDPNGNRSLVTRPSGVQTATYDDQDRLLTLGAASYTYARNGERITRTIGNSITQYGYDVLGNLRRVTLPDGTVIDYVVDAMNRRLGKKVNGTLIQAFLYQDQLNPVAELDGGGNLTSQFVYGTRSNVPDYMIKAGVTYRIVSDHLGSVRLVVRATDGVVVQQLEYDAFGQVLSNTNPGFQPFAFAGGVYDAQTGLARFGARDYDAETGQWTTKDPVGFAGGDSNLYGYAVSDPINLLDPSGLLSLNDVANYSAAFGDVVTIGLTDKIRDLLDANGTIDRCSDAYNAGRWTGFGASVALGAAIGAGAAGAASAGLEFSHWIPNRFGGPRSIFNGNYVPPDMHYYSDPYRFPPGWQDLGPKWPPWQQQLYRIPRVLGGAAAGAAWGAMGLAATQCNCK